jgi:hypothetical protein
MGEAQGHPGQEVRGVVRVDVEFGALAAGQMQGCRDVLFVLEAVVDGEVEDAVVAVAEGGRE